jgi:hypothetical protein
MILMGHAGPQCLPVPWQASWQNRFSDGGEAMRDDLDDRLHDAVALDEIDLYADVLSAVAAVDRPLTDDELDAVLGLDHAASPVSPS